MTTKQAKKVITMKLQELGQPSHRLTARTISFQDLARGDCIFVYVHGWEPNSLQNNSRQLWNELKKTAKENGFCIET